MFFCIVIMLIGVIGNVMVPIVIIRTKDMRNSTNIFLTNLSIADLLVLLVCTPTVLVELNTKPETWILGHEMCKAVPFIELTVAHASVLTILAISFERYYAICEPLKAGYVCTKTRAILICSLAWGIAALFTSPILWMAEYKFADYIDGSSVPVCLTQALTIWTLGFFLMITAVFFVFPLFILIILYGVIAKNLISDTGPMMRIRPIKPELSLKARKQVVLMLGAVVVAFFLCLLPFRLLTLAIILTPEKVHDLGVERYYNILYFSRIMLYLNSAINPILYNLMSTKFRKGFYKLIFTIWMAVLSTLTCGHCEPCGGRRKGANGLVTTTTTSSNTNTTTNTSSSILSRSSNRRSSDEVYNRTRVQIQMQMPYGSDCEMVAMLHNTNTDCRAAVVVAASLPALSSKYGVMKSHNQRRSSTTSSSSSLHNNAPSHHHRHVVSSRLKARQISFEEDADANAVA
ncbi:ecdysis triggering hormone receptor isoform X1 [Musca autumnalis]|uniref:ecdysis triggering hormone receptor isoform X1 n=1 Tax=Musca autumnalis TaxID=221902 RepID=UPI003CF6F27F